LSSYQSRNAEARYGPFVPMKVLGELILEWEEQNKVIVRGGGYVGGNSWYNETEILGGARELLAKKSGMRARRIYNIVRGFAVDRNGNRCDRVSFDTADKLVCAMRMNHEWISGRLAPFYGPIPVAGYERHLDVEAVAA
jgi:hypothetical protein